MKIDVLEFVEGARRARGVTVIIDVFRAFSVACYAYDSEASGIIATASVEEAFRLRTDYKNSVLVGERHEKKIPGFDLGNSPTEIIRADIKGKTVIHTTSAGTQGLINASGADVLITGSLVNAGAIIGFIRKLNPGLVSLVAMGYRAEVSAEEDLICAEYIRNGLLGKQKPTEKDIAGLMHTSGKRFFNPDNADFSPPTDFFYCTMTERFNFILKAEMRTDGNVDLIKTRV